MGEIMPFMRYKTIAEYLEKTGKKEAELAKALGIAQSFLNEIKNSRKRPSPKLAAQIEKITGIPFRCLLLPEQNNTTA